MADEAMREMTFDEWANKLRRDVKATAAEAKHFINKARGNGFPPSVPPERADLGEMIANLTLAYRHLEDASMRFGKAIQASDGGTSVYDRETTVGA